MQTFISHTLKTRQLVLWKYRFCHKKPTKSNDYNSARKSMEWHDALDILQPAADAVVVPFRFSSGFFLIIYWFLCGCKRLLIQCQILFVRLAIWVLGCRVFVGMAWMWFVNTFSVTDFDALISITNPSKNLFIFKLAATLSFLRIACWPQIFSKVIQITNKRFFLRRKNREQQTVFIISNIYDWLA